MREIESEPDPNDREEPEDQAIIDKFEENIYDLSGIDEKNAREISRLATANFDDNSSDWSELLKKTLDLINEYRTGEHDDDDFSGRLQGKLDEAKDLVKQ